MTGLIYQFRICVIALYIAAHTSGLANDIVRSTNESQILSILEGSHILSKKIVSICRLIL